MRILLSLVLLPYWLSAQQTQPGVPRPPGEYPAAGTNTTPRPKPEPPDLPKGWRIASDDRGLCQWAVPGNWQAVEGDDARLTYGRGNGRAELRVVTIDDWQDYKNEARKRRRPSTVLEDSAQRFWLRHGDEGLHYEVALKPAARVACVAEFHLEGEANLDDDGPMLWRMANSVAHAAARAEKRQTR